MLVHLGIINDILYFQIMCNFKVNRFLFLFPELSPVCYYPKIASSVSGSFLAMDGNVPSHVGL